MLNCSSEVTSLYIVLHYCPLQNIVSIGVVMYEAVAGAGTLTTEHTSVSEVLAAVTR